MKSLFTKFLIFVCLVAVGAGSALWAMTAFFDFSPFDSDSETVNTQLVNSITREEQVVLLSLGIQGISEKSGSSTFFGTSFPGSERSKFIQYNFKAKLGLEGKDVKIEQTGEKEFLVSIPEFIFIGHYNTTYKLIAETNGFLSVVTPEVDSLDMANEILNDDAQKRYVEENDEILKDQAEAFYRGILSSIDPTIAIRFEFHD